MDCGCAAPDYGPSLSNTCGNGTFVLFMSLLDTFIRNKCDISAVCHRVRPIPVPDQEYDFIVIGGGSGGSVAAGRLAEERSWNVLLVEAGPDEPVGTQVPSLGSNFYHNPAVDWNYSTEPEKTACFSDPQHRCQWIRGKVLGGCSVLNGMMYMRGAPRDYDNWEKAGNPGWGYKDVLPVFKKQEHNPEIGTLVDAKYHGRGGPLTVARFPYQPDLANDVVTAARELGYPTSNDLNGDQITGFAVTQTTNRNGVRESAAKAFVRPHRNDPNFHVMLNTTATKIIFTNTNGKKSATAVELVYGGRKFRVRVKKEVIVAGGTVNTPQILLLSGIGPKADLDRVNIQQVHELPGVGRNLHNHVTFYLSFALKLLRDINDLDWANALEYILNRKGPLSSTGMSQTTARLNSKYADPSGDFPDLQMFFTGYGANCATSGEARSLVDPSNPTQNKQLIMAPVVLHPKSRGYITLKSNNYLDHPLIYANYLSEPEDAATLVEGIRVAQRLGNTTLLRQKYGTQLEYDAYGDCATKYAYDSDDFWHCAVTYDTGPENHQVGSCKMGPITDNLTVVDSNLLIHGIDNVRIMDASVFPEVVSGNTAATVMMIADKGIQMLKKKWLGVNFDSRGSFPGNEHDNGNTVIYKPNPQRTHVNHGHHPHHHHSPDFHYAHPEVPNPFDNDF